MVRATGLEPARPYDRQIFVTLQLSLPPLHKGVCALDYPFIIAPYALDAARLVSTPSHHWAWHGIAISQVSPFLSGSTASVSASALKFFLSLMCLPISPRPHSIKHTQQRSKPQLNIAKRDFAESCNVKILLA